jgi:hypothetical protein
MNLAESGCIALLVAEDEEELRRLLPCDNELAAAAAFRRQVEFIIRVVARKEDMMVLGKVCIVNVLGELLFCLEYIIMCFLFCCFYNL